jgi:hypothetical protein
MGSVSAMFGLIAVLWVIVTTFIAAAVLKWLWNITLPELFGFKTVRYWQAFRLMIIAQLIFGPSFLSLTSPASRSPSSIMDSM